MRLLSNRIIYSAANALRRVGVEFDESSNDSVIAMRQAINELEGRSIEFHIEQYPDGSWHAESRNVEGLMTGSNDPREIPEMLRDAIFTYYEIPPHLCKDTLLSSDNEPATVEQDIRVGA